MRKFSLGLGGGCSSYTLMLAFHLLSHRTSFETLRPLAHSTLADLVHHVRSEVSALMLGLVTNSNAPLQLTLKQLSRTIYLYSRNIHDPSLPMGIQTMSGW